MAAPTKAHITDAHSARQLSSPFRPSRTVFSTVTAIAHRGAMTQKTTSCPFMETFHQQTNTIPKFRLAAPMIHPKQKAYTFLEKYVSQLNASTLPSSTHSFNPEATSAISSNAQMYTAASEPLTNTQIHTMSRALVMARWMWTGSFHQFLMRLMRLTTNMRVQMTAQMVKNKPGGVTQRWNLSETWELFIPTAQLTATVARNSRKLRTLIGHRYLPSTPKASSLWSESLLLARK